MKNEEVIASEQFIRLASVYTHKDECIAIVWFKDIHYLIFLEDDSHKNDDAIILAQAMQKHDGVFEGDDLRAFEIPRDERDYDSKIYRDYIDKILCIIQCGGGDAWWGGDA